MQRVEELDSGTIERLKEQGKFLLRIYQAPNLRRTLVAAATESSRSNVIALRHTVKQMYGESCFLGGHDFPALAENLSRQPIAG